MNKRSAAFLVVLICFSPGLFAQSQNDPSVLYDRTEAWIVARDGVRLFTEIYSPKGAGDQLPIILLRTPYNVTNSARRLNGFLRELANEKYIFAFQDIRGRYKSEGTFVMQRNPRKDPEGIDESTDTYDTIDWLVKNVEGNNGRVGQHGISYDGWLTVMSMLDPHPALKAVSPQASPVDMWLGDDFHHNGAFRLSYGFEYAFALEASKGDTSFTFDTYDTYEWYLNLGALSHVNERYFHNKIPTWNDYVNHPDYDQFWKNQTAVPYLKRVTVPTLNVAGWWDQEDFYGPLKIYSELEKHDMENKNFLVVGPWNHGGWARQRGDNLGNIDFDSTAPSLYFRTKIQAPWFAYFLKDKGSFTMKEAQTFQTGANQWMAYDIWPPRTHFAQKNLYFRENGKLSFGAPSEQGTGAYDEYVSDPAHPVPYRSRPIEPTYGRGSRWYTWLTEDQRFVHLRPDVLSWETEILTEDVVITGDIVANLYASTSGTDCDWVVKLIDVYPESYSKKPSMGGYQFMIANDVFRGRYRKSFEHPEPIVPNQATEFTIDLHQQDYRFLKGHKIMVQVQSTWFPVIDRNPQKYVENIFKAKESDFQKATQRVYRSRQFPSHIKVSVMK
jgi:hypothetical protein